MGDLSEVWRELFVRSGLAVTLACFPSLPRAAEASLLTSSVPQAVVFAVLSQSVVTFCR